MVVFPNAKINIGLHITGKRPDNFHNIETVFYPVAWKDALEIIEHPADGQEVLFSHSGLVIEGKSEDNFCIKAWHLLKKDFPALPAIQMHLHKTIPMGAGMGGGSADGAFTLQLINKKFGLGLTDGQLRTYAIELGSDCPFFVYNQPCFASGRGEILEPIELKLASYQILLVYPGIHINTGWAFRSLIMPEPIIDLRNIVQMPVADWKGKLQNVFEPAVFAAHPEIARLKESMYEMGALYASMSGSGSTVYGIFPPKAQISLNFPASYFHKWV